jgi:transposase-like protein
MWMEKVMADTFALVRDSNHFDNEFSGTEVVLPVQFHDRRTAATAAEPLYRLMVALLIDAIRSVQTKSDTRQLARRQDCAEARSWMFSNDDRAVFSFEAVCEALDIDPNAIRKYLSQWEEKRLAGEKPRRIARRAAASLAKRISR